MPTPVVILVGGSNAESKSHFYEIFTGAKSSGKVNIRVVSNSIPQIVLIDTPAELCNRDPYDYTWEGIFHIADIIVNFGDWSPSEVSGMRPEHPNAPVFLTWSGDHHETMKRIMDIVQRG